mmetsp:Transcript_25138/g.54874  ORF Transcript_25138/g.54874 Transcript_25138/m.54874 type:complete len:1075 (-) Transcript_25138:129-3353(-)|eukprot:CAMPEP_0178560602 /NCGR_PEP_ID=MMETSP0697-20121206/11577_1 /TAXON_ID=265572 /ORGANISM="Extubocellulus spinifer, Strain CCMP396" /LENGTH=1074 /DNA_ID=CAMNT_0020193875 /DNA_START=269 /DNA_END=3493 /DNA_ORIENTATION=+
MRSRSSRLFIVLLHLVGVSTNLPHNIWGNPFWQGIVGVHPTSIFLERLQLEAAGGLDGLLDKLLEAGYNADDVLSQPFWLQDDSDGMCFGPGGFSECGDATLWLVRKRKRRNTHLDSSANTGSQELRPVEDTASASLRIRRIIPSFLRWIIGHGREDEASWGYALELIDGHSISSRSSQTERMKPRQTRTLTKQSVFQKQEEEGECLMISSGYDMKGYQDERSLSELEQGLELGPCSSARAWAWSINGNGVLIQNEHDLGSDRLQGRMAVIDPIRRLVHSSLPQLQHGRGQARDTPVHEEAKPSCVWRVNASVAVSGPCLEDEADTDGWVSRSPPEAEALDINASRRSAGTWKVDKVRHQISKSPVTFSVLRYQANAGSDRSSILLDLDAKSDPVVSTETLSTTWHQEVGLNGSCRYELDTSQAAVINTSEVTNQVACNVSAQTPTRRGPFSGPPMHPELKPASELLFTSVSANGRASHRTKSPKKATTSFPSHLVGASPLTLGAVASTRRSKRACTEETSFLLVHHNQNRNLLHRPSNERTDQFDNDSPHKPRKIPTHSYIKESKDGVWVDPDTGLEYPTDLSEYLGHDRKATGRHTLMGVGQYTRTVFKIKVYGCALYLAKRDVLADPGFVPFASLSSEQLRSSGDFYDHLMTNEGSKGSFDRTLFVKTNMQLATEVMRNSLDADWKLLTPDHKQALISSSLSPRDAEEGMLRKIQSGDNPSRCSCGQVAPDEYEADPSCCARGTELVFTWRKNGDLELRLDGRVMDVFPDAELARGIFYEYLRGDDPMSMQARDSFADGFPFLLAPLDQVRGVSSPILPHDGKAHKKRLPRDADKRIQRFFGSIHDIVNGHMSNAGNWVQSSAGDMRSNVLNTARSLADSARNLSIDIERQKCTVQEHVSGLLEEASRVLALRIPSLFSHLPVRDKAPTADNSIEGSGRTGENTVMINQTSGSAVRLQRGRLLHQRKEETDEIGVIIDPTMNFTHRVFSYMVHFYLMLLLIVSVPGSYTTRLVAKRTGESTSKTNLTDDEISSKDKVFFFDEKNGLELSLRVSESKPISTGRMTKSLSYYL